MKSRREQYGLRTLQRILVRHGHGYVMGWALNDLLAKGLVEHKAGGEITDSTLVCVRHLALTKKGLAALTETDLRGHGP